MAEWGGRKGTEQVTIVFVFLILAFTILSLRLFTRVVVSRNHGPEDWVIAAAFCFSVAQAALVFVEVQHGQGLSQNELSEADVLSLRKTIWKAIPIYLAGLGLTKLSILLQYMRIFKDRVVHRIIIGMIVFVTAYAIWSVLGSLFLCTPVHYFWDERGDAKCMNFKAKWFSDATINIVTDLLLLGMPMPFLKGLNLPRRQKAGLIAVFALGGFVCIVSIIRLAALHSVATTNDISKHNGPAAYFSSMEVNVGIICASLPSLRAITLRTWSKTTTTILHSSPSPTSHTSWWRFGKRNDNIELEEGRPRQDLSKSETAITKVVSIQFDTRERRDSGRKSSVWSLHHGGIFDGGAAKAWIGSDGK